MAEEAAAATKAVGKLEMAAGVASPWEVMVRVAVASEPAAGAVAARVRAATVVVG